MADATPPNLTAPSGVSGEWTATDANGIGTALIRWVNHSGGIYASYARLDVYVRSKATPAAMYLLATINPYTGQVSITSSARNGWNASIRTDWQVMVRASASGVIAESSWAALDKLVTPKPNITSVVRTSLTHATVNYSLETLPVGGASMVQASRTRKGSTAGASTQVNQAVPGTSISVPIPDGINEYDLRIQALGPAGPSGWAGPSTAPIWWQAVPPATDVVVSRTASGQGKLDWTVAASTARNPLRSQRIYRAPRTGGDFVLFQTLDKSLRAWTDATTTNMSRYRYQVRTVGDLGESTTYQTVNLDSAWSEPSAPSSVSVARNALNDDAFDVTFTISETTAKPVDWIDILTRDAAGKVSTVLTVKRSNLDVTDTLTHTAGPDRLVEYAVRARNGAGSSSPLTWTAQQATTPRGAASFSARRMGADIGLYWTVASTIADGWDIERTPDDGANWFPLANSLTGVDRSFIHAAASYATPHGYRIRPKRAGAPTAAWVLVEAGVPAGAVPLAPLVDEVGWAAIGEPIPLSWQYRSIDGTPQREAIIDWRLYDRWDSLVDYGAVAAGSSSSWSLPASTVPDITHTLKIEISTQGTGSMSFGPYSTSQTVRFAGRPFASVSVPAVVESQRLVGSFTPPMVWVSATVRLLGSDGEPVATQSLTPLDGTEFSFPVADRQTGTVEVVVNDGRLDSLPAVAAFTVQWLRPATPLLRAWPEGETVQLEVTVPAGLKVVRTNLAPSRDFRDWTASAASHRYVTDGGMPARSLPPLTDSDPWTLTKRMVGDPMSVLVALDLRAASAGGNAVLRIQFGDGPVQSISSTSTEWQRHILILDATTAGAQYLKLRAFGAPVTPTAALIRDPLVTADLTNAIPGLMVPGEVVPGTTNAYFDGDYTYPEQRYGWLPDGTAYQAVEAATLAEADIRFPQPVRIELIRTTDGKSLGDIAGNRGVDPWPRFGKPDTYIARAWGDNGAYADSAPAVVTVEQRDMVVNAGDGLALRVTAGPRGALPVTGGTIEKLVRQPVGRPPLEFAGTTKSPRRVEVTADLWQHHSDLEDWVAAHNAIGPNPRTPLPALLRDPSGVIMHGVLDVDTRDEKDRYHRTVRFAFTETRPRP